jgi:hypothetical protein
VDEIMRLDKAGILRAEIAYRPGTGEASVYRILICERRKAGLAQPFTGSRAGRRGQTLVKP